MTAVDDEATNPYLAELRAQYAQNDATMSEEMKQQYPILDFEQMKERYPNEWIGFVATEPQFRQRDAKGRVIAHSPDIEAMYDVAIAFRREHPELPISTDYTGRY